MDFLKITFISTLFHTNYWNFHLFRDRLNAHYRLRDKNEGSTDSTRIVLKLRYRDYQDYRVENGIFLFNIMQIRKFENLRLKLIDASRSQSLLIILTLG